MGMLGGMKLGCMTAHSYHAQAGPDSKADFFDCRSRSLPTRRSGQPCSFCRPVRLCLLKPDVWDV